jgi:hypothetical protein
VKPNPEDQHRNLDIAYADMKYSLEVGGGKAQSNALMAEVATQFQYMRDSGIPVHVLLGRRNLNESSLYWGWPYNAKAWEKSLAEPVDAGLKPVAAHIDTLSIFYDLRNPLDERRLREIDDRQPYHGPDAHRPHPQCPWNSKDCPFKKQWGRESGLKAKGRPSSSGQKMANMQPLVKPGSKHKLANNLPSCPPTGEDADDGTSDDSKPDDYTPATLHHLATSAAFEREAVGWQSFWASHASGLTNLTELRVRMPQCFDQVGSWALSKLLSQKNWKNLAFADEREHLQTREDLVRHVGTDPTLHSHKVQEKVCPAGRFVRRTWVRHDWTTHPQTNALYREEDKVDEPSSNQDKNIRKPNTQETEGEKREREEHERAVQRARETSRQEAELEAQLPSSQVPAPTLPTAPELEAGLTGAYGRLILHTAQTAWAQHMRNYVNELQDGEPRRDTEAQDAVEMEADDAEELVLERDLLRRTRERLQERVRDFRAEDIFAVEGETRRGGVELRSVAEERRQEERGGDTGSKVDKGKKRMLEEDYDAGGPK